MIKKEITIDKRVYTVKEITMREVTRLMSGDDGEVSPLFRLLEVMTDASQDNILDMAPSGLQELVDGMVEVNTPFLSQSKAIGADKSADAFEKLIRSLYTIAYLPSSKPDTE